MNYAEASEISEKIEARFGMIGRYWSGPIATAYIDVLLPYDPVFSAAVVKKTLSDNPSTVPTDAELDRLLAAAHKPITDADLFKFDTQADAHKGKYSHQNGMAAYESGVREGYDRMGKPVADFFLKQFASFKKKGITNAQLGEAITRGAVPGPSQAQRGKPVEVAHVVPPAAPMTTFFEGYCRTCQEREATIPTDAPTHCRQCYFRKTNGLGET